jgi:hypothetical protein
MALGSPFPCHSGPPAGSVEAVVTRASLLPSVLTSMSRIHGRGNRVALFFDVTQKNTSLEFHLKIASYGYSHRSRRMQGHHFSVRRILRS